MSRVVIALGGNALGNTPAEQMERVTAACPALVEMIMGGHEIVVSHGNGPQVGMIQLAFDSASRENDKVAAMPLDACTAMSQGYIGYHLQNGLLRELRNRGLPWHVASVVTQVVVDARDPAFGSPTKPVGGFYDAVTAHRMMQEDPTLRMKEDAGRGWRRVVPSPKPLSIVEHDSISGLLDQEFVVIACGGGGIPVVSTGEGDHRGVAAVIDKDFASACLAESVGADLLVILTAVEHVCIRYGKPDQLELTEMTVAEAEQYIEAGEFAPGSMLPKVEAALRFVRGTLDRRAVIASLASAPAALRGESGTLIRP